MNEFLFETFKKLILIDKLTRKNYYMLSSLGNNKLGQTNKTIKINYNELAHQYLLIKWLVPNESMKRFIDEQIKSYNWKIDQHHIEIFKI